MKNLVRFAVAGALMAGYATAQAQSLPSSGSSDLWLFVADTTAGTGFAEDTGISINSLLPTASLAAGTTTGSNAVLSTTINSSVSLSASSALTAYLNAASAAGHTVEWAVEGTQYTLNSAGAPLTPPVPGSVKGITDNLSSADTSVANLTLGNLKTWVTGYNSDVTYLDQTYTAGGQTYTFTNGSAGGNVWGSGPGSALGGSTNLYGQGADNSLIGLGAATTLYGMTGAGTGNTTGLQSYVLSRDLTLSANGTLSTVPLPAAVWLFGSGLLGLVGVGRRRAAAV